VTTPRVVRAQDQLEGAGFLVHRPFPSMALPNMDPFLLFDQMGPKEVEAGEAKGAPDHPHRGFETVTYMIEGAMEHKDSHGHHGVLGPGDVQWMTAGSGVIHSEMPTGDVNDQGGTMHGIQLWVNLPAAQKMMDPRYQDVPSATIPEVKIDGGLVRVISGNFRGTTAVIDTIVPIRYLHVRLEAGASLMDDVPAGDNSFVYVLQGNLTVDDDAVPAKHLCHVDSHFAATAGAEGANFVVLSGKPIGEPVARYGPFVMTTRMEIQQALEDYHAGRFGSIPPELGGGDTYLPGSEKPAE
jgi:redox-sensitive bicupin YhaK (pirin superfamily)